ncbi:MAG: tetratricopeptide repeat protein, partial [Hymenobacter sp.]
MVKIRKVAAVAAVLGGLLAGPAYAQSVEFSKEKFSEDKQGLKEALRELKAGDAEYQADPARYALALPHYLAAQQFNPDNAELNIKLGDCYLHSGTKAQALSYLQRAQKLDPSADPRTHYLLARALHLSAKWAEALKEY